MGAVRRWWWLWAQCPGVGPARLAQLQRVALEHGTDLGGLWTWPLDQLRMALRWSGIANVWGLIRVFHSPSACCCLWIPNGPRVFMRWTGLQ